MNDLPQPTLPPGLPVPADDGACAHLAGLRLPSVALTSASGRTVDLSAIDGLAVVYIYPMSGPDGPLPDGWDLIPGARGCSPQACNFRDHARQLSAYGATVFGLSTQSPTTLASEVARLHLPFDLLSDEHLDLQRSLRLPLFDIEVSGRRVLKRLTLICRDGRIEHAIYPVFPPDKDAQEVLRWLARNTVVKAEAQP
ncbi:MAG: peroxiredoxin [Sphingomonadales bacterium]